MEKNLIHPERKEVRNTLIKAYKKFHCSSPEYIQNYVNDISAYTENPFFEQIDQDIEDNKAYFVQGEKLKIDWLKKLFSESHGYKGIGRKQKITVEKYSILAEKNFKEYQDRDHLPINNENNIPFEETSESLNAIRGEEELSVYYKGLQEKFKHIRLSVADFEMPIEHFIKTPLLKRDLDLKKDITDLEKQREKLFHFEPKPEKEFDELSNRIRKIEKILNKKHDIIDIIDIGKDIFIEASAGSGKSTMLRWLTYQFALNSKGFFPIFVELMYNTNDDLKSLIRENSDAIVYQEVINKNGKILLLLDGFDQFTGSKVKLFKDIKSIKNNPNVQIVFSGREVPNMSKHNLDLAIYNLLPFDNNDIKKICTTYLGEKEGDFYYGYLLSRNLERYINKPLYLCFLLAHIKRLTHQDFQQEDIILSLNVANKGRLLYDVVVNYYIGEYEKEIHGNLTNEQWKIEKLQQLEIINFIAYQMTFNLKDREVIEWREAEILIELYYNKNQKLKKFDADFIFNEFVKHNILHLQNGKLSFDKKELRLFFTGLFLKEKIKSFKDLKNHKKKFREQVNNEHTWNAMQHYLIGLIDSNPFLNSFKKIDFNAPVLLDKLFLEQFKLSLEFIAQKNFPENHSHINATYLVNIIKLFLEKFYDVKQNTKGSVIIFLLRYVSSFLIKKAEISNRYISKKMEDAFNEQFFQFIYRLHYGEDMGSLLNSLIRYDLGLKFEELIEIISIVDDKDYPFKHYLYDTVLRQENVSIKLGTKEKAAIVFDYHFNFEQSEKYSELFKYNSTRLNLFRFDSIENCASEFFNLFFEKIDTINPFSIKRFLYYLVHGRGYWLKFKDDILLPENAELLFKHTKHLYLTLDKEVKNFYKFKNVLIESTDEYLVNLFLEFFKEVFNDNLYSKEQKIRAYYYVLAIKRTQDISFLLNSFKFF